MQQSPYEIKEQLLGALDKDYNVVDMDTVIYVITVLEKVTITKDVLEKTRLGRYINELRKRTSNENLARRAKDLVKSWRKLIPQNDHVVNGERIAGGITPPGPGPGVKPSSPALSKAGIRTLGAGVPAPTSRLKPASPLVPSDRIASPLCSSASSSPLLYTVKSCARSVTPSGYAPNKCASSSSSVLSCDSLPVPRQQGTSDRNSVLAPMHSAMFKPVSPALGGNFNKSSTSMFGPSPVICPKPHSPTIGSTNNTKPKSPCLNSGKSIPGRHECDSNNQAVRSPAISAGNAHCSLDLAKTNAANKRLRKDNSNCSNQSYKKPNTSSPVNSSHATVNGLDCASEKNQIDGIRPSACSAFQTFKSEDCSQDSISAIDNSFVGTKKKRLKFAGALDSCEASKEKLTNSKLQKVKTTQQLIEELQKKKGTKMPMVTLPITSPSVVRTEINCKNPRNLGILGSDAEMTKTKSELMDRFLKYSPERALGNSPLTVKTETTTSPNSESCQAEEKGVSATVYVDTISEEIKKLVASLPSIDPSVLSDMEDEEPTPPRRDSVTDADIQRVFSEQWDHVNGVFDPSGHWHEWQDIAVIESLNGDPLHILPYVNIEW